MIRALLAAAAVVFATAAPVGLVAPAHAVTVDLTCPGTNFQLNFEPPLSGTQRAAKVTVTASLGLCTTTDPGYAKLQSASVLDAKADAEVSGLVPDGLCGVLFATTGGTGAFAWQPADQKSKFNWTVSTDPASASGITLSATVTSGPLDGDTAAAAGTAVPICSGGGLSSLTSTNVVIAFTH